MTLKVPFEFDDLGWKDIEGHAGQVLGEEFRGKVEERVSTYLHWAKQGPQTSPVFTAEMMRYHTGGRRSQKTKEEDARILTGRWGKYREPGRPPSRETAELHWLAPSKPRQGTLSPRLQATQALLETGRAPPPWRRGRVLKASMDLPGNPRRHRKR